MKIDALISGNQGLTYEAEVLQSGMVNGKMFAAHAGHNKLMHTIVISHWSTGKPVVMARVSPSVDIDKDIALKYMDYFANEMMKYEPGNAKNINDLPE